MKNSFLIDFVCWVIICLSSSRFFRCRSNYDDQVPLLLVQHVDYERLMDGTADNRQINIDLDQTFIENIDVSQVNQAFLMRWNGAQIHF